MSSPNIESNEQTCTSPQNDRTELGTYSVLMETNEKECESWYYFIRNEGNEENLKDLKKQLDSIKEVYAMEDMSIFYLETRTSVSAQTAKEMSLLDINEYSYHRKFDGKLQFVDLEFSSRDSDETKMCKTCDRLGYGKIEDYIDNEDVDTDDSSSDTSCSSDSDESSDDTYQFRKELKVKNIPSTISDVNDTN